MSSYAKRTADEMLFDALHAGGLAWVFGPRQIGKSCLLRRAEAALFEEGARVAVVDMSLFAELSRESLSDVLFGLVVGIAKDVDATPPPGRAPELVDSVRWWLDEMEALWASSDRPLVVLVDEIDAVSSSKDGSGRRVLSAFRALVQRERVGPRLAIGLFGVGRVIDAMGSVDGGLFGVGRRIELADFSDDEAVALLGDRPEAREREALAEILQWTSGHPLMTTQLLEMWRDHPGDVSAIARGRYLDEGVREQLSIDVERQLDEVAPHRSLLLALYREILLHGGIFDDPRGAMVERLVLLGLARRQNGKLVQRNRLYAEVFNLAWAEQCIDLDALREAADLWSHRQKPVRLLADAALLARVEEMFRQNPRERTPLEQSYLDASRAQLVRQKLRQVLSGAVLVVLVLVMASLAVTVHERNLADQAAQRALIEAASLAHMAPTDAARCATLAAAALSYGEDPVARGLLIACASRIDLRLERLHVVRGKVNSLSWSSGGSLLVAAEGELAVWEQNQWRSWPTEDEPAHIWQAAWQEGRIVTSELITGERARLFTRDAMTGVRLAGAKLPFRDALGPFVLLPGTRLAVGGSHSGNYGVIDLDGEPRAWGTISRRINAMALRPDGGVVAIVGQGDQLRCVATDTGEATVARAHGGPIAAAWNAGGTVLATSGDPYGSDGTINLWGPACEPMSDWRLNGEVRGLSWSGDGVLWAVLADGHVASLKDGVVRADVGTPLSGGEAIAVGPGGWVASGAGDGAVALWTRRGQPVPEADRPLYAFEGVGNGRVAVGREDMAWWFHDGDVVELPLPERTQIGRAGPGGRELWVGDLDGGLWSVPWSGEPPVRVLQEAAGVLDIAVQGELLAWVAADRVRWRDEAGVVREAQFPDTAALEVDVDDRATALVVACSDGRVVRVNVLDGTVVELVPPGGEAATAVALSRDGASVVVGRVDGTVCLHESTLPQCWTAHQGNVTDIRQAEDGAWFTAGDDGRVVVWSRAHAIAAIPAHLGIIHRISFEGDAMLTAAGDTSAGVWEMKWLSMSPQQAARELHALTGADMVAGDLVWDAQR